MESILRRARLFIRKPSIPRQFPTTGFEIIASSHLVEEEKWEWYTPEEFYPVRMGEVFQSRWQVVGKLGYGAYGVAWLCRDLLNHKHVALKVATPEAVKGELRALRHFATIKTNHLGSLIIRQKLDDFVIDSKYGTFQGITYPPLAISVKAFRMLLPKRALPVNLLKVVLKYLLIALDFLHTEAKVIHTDIQESNILLGMNEETAKLGLEKYEQEEQTSPCARKIDGERVIYTSRQLIPSVYRYGTPVLCDFGEARVGDYDNMIDIQPYQYRAPEVIFEMG